jgi:hypothetical protein
MLEDQKTEVISMNISYLLFALAKMHNKNMVGKLCQFKLELIFGTCQSCRRETIPE